jgi:DNA-binding response OmpR family regulator
MVMAIRIGANDFIAKPLEIDVVVAKIQALLHPNHNNQVPPKIYQFKALR